MLGFLMPTLCAAALASTAAPSLAECINTAAKKLDFSGTVSVVRPEGPTSYSRGILGAPGSPGLGPHTRFNLASAGKMFTAVAVAQLVDAGKVGLDDPIGRHLKGLNAEVSAVTVRQLLTHSGGLGNFFSPENLPALEKARTASDLLPLVASDRPAFPPGARFQYSNSGFLLLGVLVERVAGQSFGAYLDQHIFRPAKMSASGFDPGPASAQAVGMTTFPAHPPEGGGPPTPGPLRPARESQLHGSPAGGSYSTADDLQKFFAALLGGKLTSGAMLQQLTSPQISAAKPAGGAPGMDYGFGFGVGTSEGHRWFGHNGGAPGVNAEAAAYPDDGTTVVVLSNRDPPTATRLFRQLEGMLLHPERWKSCASAAATAPEPAGKVRR